jgi:hypothetical protein
MGGALLGIGEREGVACDEELLAARVMDPERREDRGVSWDRRIARPSDHAPFEMGFEKGVRGTKVAYGNANRIYFTFFV